MQAEGDRTDEQAGFLSLSVLLSRRREGFPTTSDAIRTWRCGSTLDDRLPRPTSCLATGAGGCLVRLAPFKDGMGKVT